VWQPASRSQHRIPFPRGDRIPVGERSPAPCITIEQLVSSIAGRSSAWPHWS
jgi:hypothetical protein